MFCRIERIGDAAALARLHVAPVVDTLNWMHWFNYVRPHRSVDDLTPIEVKGGIGWASRLIPTGWRDCQMCPDIPVH